MEQQSGLVSGYNTDAHETPTWFRCTVIWINGTIPLIQGYKFTLPKLGKNRWDIEIHLFSDFLPDVSFKS